jgi:prolyl oligopeptidase
MGASPAEGTTGSRDTILSTFLLIGVRLMFTRHIWSIVSFAALIGIALTPNSFSQTANTPASPELAQFFKQYFEETLRLEPEFATNVGRHEYDDRWTDLSAQGVAARRSHLETTLQQLDRFAPGSLSGQDRLSVELLRYDLRSQLEAFDLETYLLRVGQLFGAHNRVYLVIDRMPALTVHDAENTIARLRAVPAYVDQNIAIFNEAIGRGWTQPKIVTDLVIEQMKIQVAQDATNTPLLAFLKKLPPSISEADRTRLRDQATAAFNDQFHPAWSKWLAYMQTTYLPKARPNIGISSVPGGPAAYQTLIRRSTTTTSTPEEIHRLGLAEVDRIEAEMQAIARQSGFNGTVSELELKLADAPEQRFHSKDEMLAYCRNAAKIIEPELPGQFKHIPPLLYGIRAIPEDREQASASNAQAPAPDGSAPGWFNLRAYEPEKQVRYDKESLVLHEAVPGHIFQGSLARSLSALPEFRRFYGNSAYNEGWALYAESLGSLLGVYRDPYNRFGQLASERFRAARLVIDTGIHSMGWTREQAQAYLHDHAPTQALAEVDRYISWPGQALSYKMGQLEIVKLRKESEQKLGPKFDVRDFHDAILRNGALPLDLLDKEVRQSLEAAP